MRLDRALLLKPSRRALCAEQGFHGRWTLYDTWLLDPKDGNVTIATLQRAARIVGRTLRLELI